MNLYRRLAEMASLFWCMARYIDSLKFGYCSLCFLTTLNIIKE